MEQLLPWLMHATELMFSAENHFSFNDILIIQSFNQLEGHNHMIRNRFIINLNK